MVVSIVKLAEPFKSLREAVSLCDGFAKLDKHARIMVKPNISVGLRLPPYGMITTTCMLEALLQLLIEEGCSDITIAEGSIEVLGLDTRKACARTDIDKLATKYGVRLMDLNRGPFRQVELEGFQVQIAQSALETDFLINVPVLKTHGLTKVSLGFKNLKGCLSPASKTKFHGSNRLNRLIYLLNEVVKSDLTIIDGTYMLERGPDTLLGTARRKDLIIASQDKFACDVVGSAIMGIDPSEVGYLRAYAESHGRPLTTDGIQIEGEKDIKALGERLEWKPDVAKELLAPAGVTGISVPYPGDSLCSRCYANLGLALVAFVTDNPNRDCDELVICCGKDVRPEHEGQRAILYGNCAINNHDGSTGTVVAVKGCPPRLWDTLLALHVMTLGRRRSLGVVPKEIFGLAGAKLGVYEYALPKWKTYDSEGFDKRHFKVSLQRCGSRSRSKGVRQLRRHSSDMGVGASRAVRD
ncbi:MAG: DUF362 domain-containing protein [Dehalococcoidia bacterium]|nr:DUF362 domain-containing protein [Dehalococcoidia bacterium]